MVHFTARPSTIAGYVLNVHSGSGALHSRRQAQVRSHSSLSSSFAYDITTYKWPTILTQVVDGIFRECNQLSQSSTTFEKVAEGKALIEKISAFKYELTHDRPLKPLGDSPSDKSPGPYHAPAFEPYDSVISQTKPTWFQSDWLFAGCYFYRSLRQMFESSIHWKDYDPFTPAKMEALRASGQAIHSRAMWMEELLQKDSQFCATHPNTQKIFKELIMSSLCNGSVPQNTKKTDSSITSQPLLVDDFGALWKKIQSLQNERVDIVLGHTGFELFADLLLADALLALRGPIPQATKERAQELQGRVETVRSRIAKACKAVCTTSEPRLLAVSKLHPPSDLMAVYERTGQRHFGENYVQELVEKAAVLPDDIKWHFIGGLQSNKAKVLAAVPNLYAVESIDSEKLAQGLEKALAKAENESRRTEPLYVYVQVNTSGEEGKSGVPAMTCPWSTGQEKPKLLQLVETILLRCPHLRLQGFMTIGALTNSQTASNTHENPDFKSLSLSRTFIMDALQSDADFQHALSQTRWWLPTGQVTDVYRLASETEFGLSMGMSADLEAAVALGSTQVRIGSDCFGQRTSNQEAGEVRAAEMSAFADRPVVREVVFHTKNMPWFVYVRMKA